MKRHFKRFGSIIIGFALFYVLFFPSLTPEMAVRMSLLIRQPIVAFSGSVEKGVIKNEYFVNSAKRPFYHVKKYRLGWYASAGDSGP